MLYTLPDGRITESPKLWSQEVTSFGHKLEKVFGDGWVYCWASTYHQDLLIQHQLSEQIIRIPMHTAIRLVEMYQGSMIQERDLFLQTYKDLASISDPEPFEDFLLAAYRILDIDDESMSRILEVDVRTIYRWLANRTKHPDTETKALVHKRILDELK